MAQWRGQWVPARRGQVLNALMRWINVSTPAEVAVDFYGGVLGCDVIPAPRTAAADEPTESTARPRYSWVPLVSIGHGSGSSTGPRLPGTRASRLIHSPTGPPVALMVNGDDDDVGLLAAELPAASQQLATTMRRYWTQCARSGTPSSAGAACQPAVGRRRRGITWASPAACRSSALFISFPL